MFDIVALGETLIDFTPDGKNTQGSQLYAQNPGGAPANVLAMYAKLGGRAAFIGKGYTLDPQARCALRRGEGNVTFFRMK